MAGGLANNPLVDQGALNRVRTHLVVPDHPELDATASYMAKGQATLTFDGDIVQQIGTATGVCNSPEPYVMSSIEVVLLRSQALANNWINQMQLDGQIGNVTIYPDSSAFQPITVLNCSIKEVVPGPFDGNDPSTKVTIRGSFPTNAIMWAQA